MKLFTAIAVGLSALALPLVAQEPAPLRIVTSFEVASLDPVEEGFWMPEFGVAELLVRFRQDGRHHPWLLEAFETVDPLTWRLTLRDGLAFQNGKPVDAAAVMKAITRQLELSSSARGSVPEGARFEQTGPLEITVTTAEPWPSLPGILANESIFMIYDAEAVDAVDGDWARLVGAGIYTGPYAVTALDAAAMTLVRNENYWQGRPALPGVEVSFVTDPNARILAVQNGEADIALYPPIALRQVVEATPSLRFNHGTPGTGGFMGFMNIAQAPLDDVAVRRAVMAAIDYEEIAQTVFGGVLDTATGLYNPIFPFAVQNYGTDPAAAAALLDAAGWTPGSDGIREKDGTDLSLTIVIYPQQPDLVPLSGAVQAQLREVGIEVTVQSADDIYTALGEGGLDWDLGISAEGTTSWGIPEPFLNRYLGDAGTRNFAGYDNDELQRLTAELAVTVDPAARTDKLARIQEILVTEDPYVFSLVFQKGRVVTNELYAGYRPGFALFHLGWDTAPSPAD